MTEQLNSLTHSDGKEFACNAGDLGSIPGLGRSPGEGKDYSLQYSDLENSMDCIVHGVTKSQTRLSEFHFSDHKEPVASDRAPGHQLCRNEFPIKMESSETYKVFIRKKEEYV